MLSAAQNELLTRTGPGTPGGALMRRYWQPVALAEELDNPRPVKPVRLLGQDLVLFRDEAGRLGLFDRHCCHRGADLAFGRLENGGLRCPFHGWLYDTSGACLEQPAEPEGSDLHRRVQQPAYPCTERNGMIFAWLGDNAREAAPPLPDLDCFAAPEAYSFAWKGWWECNWLQALEVGIDPAHASFLHRFFEDDERRATASSSATAPAMSPRPGCSGSSTGRKSTSRQRVTGCGSPPCAIWATGAAMSASPTRFSRTASSSRSRRP